MIIDGTVGQLQLYGRELIDGGISAACNLGQLKQVFLGHRVINLHCVDIRDGGQRLRTLSTYQSTNLIGNHAYYTTGGALYVAETQ